MITLGFIIAVLGGAIGGWVLGYLEGTKRMDGKQYGGDCEVCGEYGMICLGGQRFLCWDHYCEEMRKQRSAAKA